MGAVRAAIIGGGLCGNLLALCLARRGYRVDVFERRAPPAAGTSSEGRSINLALAARGLEALRRFDALEAIEPMLLPMRGRMLHEPGAEPLLVRYGAAGECIYSVSRAALNRRLGELAAAGGVRFHFESECTGLDEHTGQPIVASGAAARTAAFDVVFAADGAGSAVRRCLAARGLLTATETLLDHGYKELSIPASRAHGGASDDAPGFALAPDALHIWPRSQYMLIALPNTDGSFTATLFMSVDAQPGFASLNSGNVEAFFDAQFADARGLFDDLPEQFANNAVGELGTVRCSRWHADNCTLIGDAAHAIVPFHGQGMNAAFEDVRVLDELLDELGAARDWPQLLAAFGARRIDDANAIADMALENYHEMRAAVRDPAFLLQHDLGLELARRFPERFVSRYEMVMFRPDIPYASAQRLGERQKALLLELTRNAKGIDDVDFELAGERIAALARQP